MLNEFKPLFDGLTHLKIKKTKKEGKKMNTKTKVSKKRSRAILSILLIAAILITGAFAFLTAQDSKTNVFTVGSVKIELSEQFDTDLNGQIDDDETFTSSNSDEDVAIEGNIVPGQTVIKRPYVDNTGKNEAWIYITVGIPTDSIGNVTRDENGDVAITKNENNRIEIPVQAYAIQKNYKNETTADGVWSAYIQSTATSIFGSLEENEAKLSDRIPLFTIINDNGAENKPSSDWHIIGDVYKSQDGNNYYTFAYDSLLDVNTSTTFAFEAVKLIDEIGNASPIKLNYYKVEQADSESTANGTINLSSTTAIPENYELVKTEYYMPGDTVTSLYFDTTLAKTGYSFDWRFIDDETKSAYPGMTINTDTDLLTTYSNEMGGTESDEYTGTDWLVYSVEYDNISGTLYAVLNGADYGHAHYPTGSTTETVLIPANITVTRTSDTTYSIPDGTFKQASDGAASHMNIGETYKIPVTKMQGNKDLTECQALANITKKVIIGDNIHYIGGVFEASSTLEQIVLPYAATESNSSFKDCDQITSVEFPNNFVNIGDYMFEGCDGLQALSISNGVQTIGAFAFSECNNLTTLTTPDTLTKIYERAFSTCAALSTISLSNSVEYLDKGVFENCPVSDFTMGKNIHTVASETTYKWNGVPVIRFTGSIEEYCAIETHPTDLSALYIDGQLITGSLNIPDGVTAIPDYAFKHCTLTDVTIPSSVKNIGNSAFYETNVKTLSIAEGVETIGNSAFISAQISELVLPSTITSIGGAAFRYAPIKELTKQSEFNTPDADKWENEIFGGPSGSVIEVLNLGKEAETASINSTGLSKLKAYYVDDNNPYLSDIDGVLYSADQTALYSCPPQKSGEVNVPASTNSIASMSGCQLVTAINVDKNNTIFASEDGVVYNKEKTELKIFPGGKTTFVMPESLASIPSGFFAGSKIRSVTFNNIITEIKDETFMNSALRAVEIPDNIADIGERAFAGCSVLGTIKLPQTLASIGANAFLSCPSIVETYYAGSVDDWNAISFGNSFSTPNFSNKNYSWFRDVSFYVQGELITNLAFSAETTTINEIAFSYLSQLTSIDLSNIKELKERAFTGCKSLTSITFPESVTTIGNYAFSGCKKVTDISLSDKITEIGAGAFSGCKALTRVTLPNQLSVIYESTFKDCTVLNAVSIPNGIVEIRDSAFAGCTNLTSITIPATVSHMGTQIFSGCTNLTSATINGPILGSSLFEGCSKLSNVVLSNNLQTIEQSAFTSCTALENIAIPDSVTTIAGWVFSNCSSLKEICIPESVTSIDTRVFNNCTSLKKVTFNSDAPIQAYYWDRYFAGCNNIETVIFGDEVTHIDNWFQGKTNLKTVSIGSEVTIIGANAFNGCSGLVQVNIPEKVETISNSAFEGCGSLTSITIPQSVKAIGEKAFKGCSGLTSIVIPSGVTTLSSYSLANCDALTVISIPDTVTVLGDYAFSNDFNLTTINFSGTMSEWNDLQSGRTFVMLGLSSGVTIRCSDETVTTQ